ncbi:MAG: hypothetical protein ABIQ35_13385 [Verrucomicrobiota bacterium]
MNPSGYKVRRATTDDVAELLSLWKSAHLPAEELDKRFTEFQIVQGAEGKLLGATGLKIAGSEGKLHSEAFFDFGLTDPLRPLLWERIQSVATNHGLFRLWTEEPAPFWKKECGFIPPSGETLAKYPVQFGKADARLLVLQLKDDRAAPSSLDAEFALFKAEEKERSEKMFRQARLFKGVAIGLSVVLFVFVAIGLMYLFRYRNRIAPTHPPAAEVAP